MALAVAAALQIFDDVVRAPRFEPAAVGAIEPRRKPAVDQAAAKLLAALLGAEEIPGRVACAAMRGALDQIAAAIPFRALVLIRLEDAGPEEGKIPDPHQHAVVQRPTQLRGGWRVSHRRKRSEIGPDRQHV